ncbi:MAG TPA: hypothetical protein VLG47_05055 [Candidatus Saccharimonadales bacterium]|nr:hypothetical protein [Candidatus Saccharimonadales bacterium]
MDTAESADKPASFILMSGRQVIGTVITGVIVGLLSWGLALLLDTYVFKTLFCHSMMTTQCQDAPQYAAMTASLLAAAAGIFALVKLQVFRPLLVGLASVIGLWGLMNVMTTLSWQISALLFVGLFAVSYLLFAWVARLRSFGLSVIIMVVLVVAVRFVLNS